MDQDARSVKLYPPSERCAGLGTNGCPLYDAIELGLGALLDVEESEMTPMPSGKSRINSSVGPRRMVGLTRPRMPSQLVNAILLSRVSPGRYHVSLFHDSQEVVPLITGQFIAAAVRKDDGQPGLIDEAAECLRS